MLLVLIILPLVGLFLALFLLLLLLLVRLLLIIDRLVVLHLFRVAQEVADLFLSLFLVHHLLFIDARSVIYIIIFFLFGQVVFLFVMTFINNVLLILGVFSLDLHFFALFNIIGVLDVLLLVKVLVLGLFLHLLINFHPIGAVVLRGKPVLHVSEVLLRFR